MRIMVNVKAEPRLCSSTDVSALVKTAAQQPNSLRVESPLDSNGRASQTSARCQRDNLNLECTTYMHVLQLVSIRLVFAVTSTVQIESTFDRDQLY